LDELEEIKDKISNEFSKIIAYEKTVQVVDECGCGCFFWGLDWKDLKEVI